jgi:hypothetical protein
MKSLITFFSTVCIGVSLLISVQARAEADISPQELFSKLNSRIDEIPENWASENPIRVNVCFNLKHKINSKEANAFLDDLYRTIDDFEFDVEIRIFRTMYPVKLDYCATMEFPDWEAQREYETSEEFLSFYKTRWKAAVTDTEEHWAVEDLRAGRK